MVDKQLKGASAPDGSKYVTLTDGAGSLGTLTLATGDLQLGAVEIKDGTTDTRVAVAAGTAANAVRTVSASDSPDVTSLASLVTIQTRPATGTLTSVADTNADGTILASNANRKGAS